MKPKSTLLLVLVFVVLAGAYWATGFLKQREETELQAAKRLFDFAPEAVKAIELKRVDGPLCSGERTENGWRFTQPNPTIEALPLVWDRMAKALAELKNERTIAESPGDAAAYGMAEPRLVFSATVEGHGPIRLVFGSPEPTQVNRFARLNDGPVFLVNEKSAFFELDRAPDTLRNRFLVDNREAPMLRMEFTRIWTGRDPEPKGMEGKMVPGQESKVITVVRDTKDTPWRMLTPVEAAADQEAVEALAKEIQFALGEGYVDTPEDLADYGLTPANARLTVVDSDKGARQTFFFGDADKSGKGRLFVKRDDRDAVFTVDGALLGKLPNTTEAFRERRLLTGQAKEIESIQYFSNASSFALVRTVAGGWAIEGEAEDAIAQERVSDFFTRLKDAAVMRFVDPDGINLEQPDVVITIAIQGDEKPREIRLKAHPQDAGLLYAVQDAGQVGLISADQAKQIMVSPDSFRSLALMRYFKADAHKITFSLEGKPYEFEKVHDLWVVRVPENHRLANQADADMILTAFAGLNASGEAPASAAGADGPGLENPILTMSITTTGADGNTVEHGPLYVGKILPGQASQRFSALGGREGIFTIKQDVIDKVRDALHGVIPSPTAQ